MTCVVRARWAVLVIIALASCGFDDPPPTPEQMFVQSERAEIANALKVEPILRARPISQILKFSLVQGHLRSDLLATDVPDTGTIPLEGLEGYCFVQRFGDALQGPTFAKVTIHLLDPLRPGSVTIDNFSNPSQLNLTMTTATTGKTVEAQLIARQSALALGGEEAGATLYVQTTFEPEISSTASIQLAADSPAQLIETYHDQMYEALGQGFAATRSMHLLSGMDERQVQQFLASGIPVPQELANEIVAIVKVFDADPDTGEKQLRRLLETRGPSAAAALVRTPRFDWSADLTLRVDTILAPFLPDDPRAPDHAGNDPLRLIDLLYWPDESIRAGVLAQLKLMCPKPIVFAPGKDPYDQVREIEAIRTLFAEEK